MSLLVHLPFIGDLKNKGLIELPNFSKNSFTSSANGKLGSCYSGHGVVSLSEEILGNAWSVAIWVKSTVTWPTANYIIFCKNISAATDCQIYFSIINGKSLNLGMNDDNTVGSFSYTFELDVWYHVAATYDGETYRLYINGSEVKSGTSTLPMVENRLHLGIGCRSYNAAGTSATGQADGKFFNDFRLYNNAISAREVKELSKGLVAHWKLDDLPGNENLLISTPKYLNHNAYNAYQFSLTENLVAGNKYTIQLWDVDVSHSEKTESQLGVSVYWGGSSVTLGSWYGTANFTNGHADHLVKIFTVTSANASGSGASNAWLNLYNSVGYVAGTRNMKIGRWKLEKGSTPTPWIPAKSDAMYSDWGLDEVYDSSGYGHDGTLSPTPPTFDSDSARYSGCMKFSSNYIHCGLSNLYPTDEITVAWWGYMDSWGSSRPISCTETGGWNFGQGDGGGWRFPVYKNGIGYVYSVPAKKWADYTSGWHFFVGTFDGYVSRIYVDGELDSTSTNGSPTVKATIMYRANVPIYIGCEANGANPSSPYFNGKLSDIRIYATALSADDIKELYNTSASIDDHHNVYARELVED